MDTYTERISALASSLTPAQKRMMRNLDGAWSNVPVWGGRIRTARALCEKGLVVMHYIDFNKDGRTHTRVEVSLRAMGQDMLYTGRLDH